MKREILVGLLVWWSLWFTQAESRPILLLPANWSMLGWFETESACNAFGQRLIDQLARVRPPKGYTRGAAVMTILDTRLAGPNQTEHEVQTTLV